MNTAAPDRAERTPPTLQEDRTISNQADADGLDFTSFLAAKSNFPVPKISSQSEEGSDSTSSKSNALSKRSTLEPKERLDIIALLFGLVPTPAAPTAVDEILPEGQPEAKASNPAGNGLAGGALSQSGFNVLGDINRNTTGSGAPTLGIDSAKSAPADATPTSNANATTPSVKAPIKGDNKIGLTTDKSARQTADAPVVANASTKPESISESPLRLEAPKDVTEPTLDSAKENPVPNADLGPQLEDLASKRPSLNDAREPREDERSTRIDGTPAASPPPVMQLARFQDAFAGGGKQNLPNSQEGSSQRQQKENSGDTIPAALATTDIHQPVDAQPAHQNPAAPDSPLNHAARVEKLGELIHAESLIMRQVKPANLTAVLRPDAQTEMHLQLKFDRNGIEATCRCERGDIQALKSSWPELQQRLAQHGVRLFPLENARANSSNPSTASVTADAGNQSRRDRNDESRPAWNPLETETRFPIIPASKSNSNRPARTEQSPLRLLESWA